MCRKVACTRCGLPTWKGCGLHIDACLDGVTESERCPGWRTGICVGPPLVTVEAAEALGLQRQKVPNDGSCLFYSIDLLTTGETSVDCSLRNYCADTILAIAAEARELSEGIPNEVYLGRSPEDYAAWIRNPVEYGGQVEIMLLAQLKQCKINLVSLESLNILPHEPQSWRVPEHKIIYIIYNGQHYDALVGLDGRFMFNEEEEVDLNKIAIALVTDERKARDLELRTRVRKKIRCSCGEILVDASAFQEHASVVDHGEDWGYECEEVVVEELVDNAEAN